MSKELLPNKVFGDVDTIYGPILDLVLFELQLAFHRVCTVLHSQVLISKIGIDLSQVEESHCIGLLDLALFAAPS